MEKPKDFDQKQQEHRNRFNDLNAYRDLEGFDNLATLMIDISDNHFPAPAIFKKWVDGVGIDEAFTAFMCKVVALEHSEASETLEEARLSEINFDDLLLEQADVVIRTMGVMQRLLHIAREYNLKQYDEKITPAAFIASKIQKNIERPWSHGGKRF